MWLTSLLSLLRDGKPASPRGMATKEIMGFQTKIPMEFPVMGVLKRELGYKFMAAEAAWILSGDNRVSTIKPYSSVISRFSDDGQFFFGAYGPKIRDQLPYIIEKLGNASESRHALLNIWREQPRNTKDVPCTISLQWLIRDDELHCFDTMRSSDIWLGWPYDVFNMSMVSLYLMMNLRKIYPERFQNLKLGTLTLTAASQHIYETNFLAAEAILGNDGYLLDVVKPKSVMPNNQDPQDLIDRLWEIANMDTKLGAIRALTDGVWSA